MLYNAPATDFLDEYGRFIYDGQAARIRACRESMGMDQKTYAMEMGIPIRCLRMWKKSQKKISCKSWDRYFKR